MRVLRTPLIFGALFALAAPKLASAETPSLADETEAGPLDAETSSTAANVDPFAGRDEASLEANTSTTTERDDRLNETISIIGRRLDTRRVTGSAHQVDEEALADFEYDDVHRVLAKIPGVYVRDEDGFGLRPNIGLRGANSDRSSRVVLMEDGILLAPAPYAAPAAYFIPLTTRLAGIEVFKGPVSIQYGPYTVGGAINYQTAEIPLGHAGMADVSAGQFGYTKIHARYGWGNSYTGFLVEGVRLSSTGFKEIDFDPDANTGFAKNEVMVKARVNTDPTDEFFHRLSIKLGYSDEVSNETYLGLTDDDFRDDPFRRYRGSELARMDWRRTQAQVAYNFSWDEAVEIRLVAYRHDFTRAWLKLNRYRTLSGQQETSVEDVLRNQDELNNRLLLQMTRGERSRADIFSQETVPSYLGIGTNDRTFVSQGIQLDTSFRFGIEDFQNHLQFGARVHYDEIERRHDEAAYEMIVLNDPTQSGVEMADVIQAGPIEPTLSNDESALAVSLYLKDEITLFDELILTPGVRTEIINTRSNRARPDNLDQQRTLRSSDVVLIPGLGAYYQIVRWLGFLAGAHRGFSPVAPGQFDEIKPETSWNYEAGFRFKHGRTRAEVIGFISDYTNFLVTCTFSSGCPNDQVGLQFNAGDIFVGGLEATAGHVQPIGAYVILTVDGSYTLTQSSFQNTFTSGSPQFADVEDGDELPYVPEHQANLSLGITARLSGINPAVRVSYTFVDRMRNLASQGDVPDIDLTDRQHLLDATILVDIAEQYRVYVRGDNLLNQRYIASRRPFGARPGKPLQILAGFRFQFGD